MSIMSKLLGFLGLGKEKAPASEIIEKKEEAAPEQVAATRRTQRREPQAAREQAAQPSPQNRDDGTGLILGSILIASHVNAQDNDDRPSPQADFHGANKHEPAHDHSRHDTGISGNDGAGSYSPPYPPSDYGGYGGGGGGYDDGGGGTFAPQML